MHNKTIHLIDAPIAGNIYSNIICATPSPIPPIVSNTLLGSIKTFVIVTLSTNQHLIIFSIFFLLDKEKAHSMSGLFMLDPGDDLLSHGEAPHYHRRSYVSLLSSEWIQVVP